ncbi:hypothetical protein SAMN05443661_11655 [Natronobacterium gregoryi]|uniref:Uncharacterized protein n=2 Tax=Natronobacterium gregoryi TaxID=44930 RepID=L0AIB4_NATGS|nr:hypothetical protein Natgr_2380 [Natronobacterium gregoryi SP2]SFJ17429.1 hypothetical protein SAMN05443661_11655 [Natronobacterium gregoryi]
MTNTWSDLFERGSAYDVSLEEIRAAIDDLEADDE